MARNYTCNLCRNAYKRDADRNCTVSFYGREVAYHFGVDSIDGTSYNDVCPTCLGLLIRMAVNSLDTH